MPSSIKDQIANDLKQVKETGQLRTERVREIVRSAVAQVASELKQGSGDIRSLVKDAISGAIAGVRERGSEAKEEITASIEGAIDGVNSTRQRTIAEAQAEIKQLLAKLDTEEEALQQQVDSTLTEVEEVGKEESSDLKAAIESAIRNFKDSEEANLLKKRYAQLQAQAAILRANLAARHGGRFEEVQHYLDDAKKWYEQSRAQAETEGITPTDKRRVQLEERLGEAGSAVARRESKVRRILSDLLRSASEALREPEHSHKELSSKSQSDISSSKSDLSEL